MSHELEIQAGKASMAWAGEVPWHGLGKKVPSDLTPAQMLEAAGLDWKVEMRKLTFELNGKRINASSGALVRLPNGKNVTEESILTEVRKGTAWHPVQNGDAFAFFNDFVAKGDMEMHTAGSLCGGELVWALAKVKDGFAVKIGKKRDEVDSHFLFSNPHRYRWSTSVNLTPIRVVCWNTISMALNGAKDKIIRINHKKKLNADEIKITMGIAHEQLMKYKEASQFLAEKKAETKDVVAYFSKLFPAGEKKEDAKRKQKDVTKAAATMFAVLETQPGADVAPGTWWNAFNAATFYIDHVHGKTADSRLTSSWYGGNRKKKLDALNTAVEFAGAA